MTILMLLLLQSAPPEVAFESFKDARAATDKPTLLVMCVDYAGPCKVFERHTLKDPKLVTYLSEHFHVVRFNAEGDSVIELGKKTYRNPNFKAGRKGRNSVHQLTRALGVRAFPSFVVLDERGQKRALVVGAYRAERLIAELRSAMSSPSSRPASQPASQPASRPARRP